MEDFDLDSVIVDHITTALVLVGMDDDPIARFRAATMVATWVRNVTTQNRREAINEMRAAGLTLAEIGDQLGLSRARIDQIAHGK